MTETPTEQTRSHPAPTNLSSLRRSWSAQHLPSFPVTDQAVQTGGRVSRPQVSTTNLPELPSLGAIANKAAFAMDGYEELFGHDKPKDSSPSQIDISELPAENSIFKQGASAPSTQSRSRRSKITDIPLIPEQTLAKPSSPRVHRSSGLKTTGLTAMPVMEAPNVSIPLVRDQFTEPADLPTSPTSPPVAPTPLQTTPSAGLPSDRSTPPSSPPSAGSTAEPVAQSEPRSTKPPAKLPDTPQYTDDDLRAALNPIIAPCVDKFLYTPTHGIHTYLELCCEGPFAVPSPSKWKTLARFMKSRDGINLPGKCGPRSVVALTMTSSSM